MGEEFWEAFDGLDRHVVIEETLAELAKAGRPMTIGELVQALPPAHDLETLALWLGMAREAGIEVAEDEVEEFELIDAEQQRWLYRVPKTGLSHEPLQAIDWEL